MYPDIYRNLCIFNVFNGLVEGLSQFSKKSRVALIYAVEPTNAIRIYDPQNLLKGHELKLKELYIDNSDWRDDLYAEIDRQPKGHFITHENLGMAGLISSGGSSMSFFYQMWFTDHHPNICSIHPTERWLEHAGWLLSQDFASDNISMGTSGHVLQNYALHALTDHIVDTRNKLLGLNTRMLIHPILNTVLNISKTREEGAWPRGELVFMDPDTLSQIDFIAKIQAHERPRICNTKHIRKLLLAVERSSRKLISDGKQIIGISESDIPEAAIIATFHGDHGFLELAGEKICSFYDGTFHSTTRKAKLVELEELLLDTGRDTKSTAVLFQTITRIIHSAEHNRHGCTLVIDLNRHPVRISGHILEPCLDLQKKINLDLACSLIKIDGALHIMAHTNALRGFGCLLDGKAISRENMARGARYNSALRFTAAHDKVVIIVVSSDRPVSVIHHGIDINGESEWNPLEEYPSKPLNLKTYINGVLS
ncbi:MAG: DNA integrity scanning protein DisA nucleotide-binding domain protein [Desulfobacteraceae bacterium]